MQNQLVTEIKHQIGLMSLIYKENKKLSTGKNAISGSFSKNANRYVKNRLQFIDSIGDNKGAVSTSPAFKGIKTLEGSIPSTSSGIN